MILTELLTDLASGINALIRSAASQLQLTASQAFHLLSIPIDGIPMSQLAHKFGLDPSTLTRNIQKLEKMDLVERKAENYDKRVQIVLLTRDGTRLLQSLEEILTEQNHYLLEQLDLQDQQNILESLEKLTWSIECTREK